MLQLIKFLYVALAPMYCAVLFGQVNTFDVRQSNEHSDAIGKCDFALEDFFLDISTCAFTFDDIELTEYRLISYNYVDSANFEWYGKDKKGNFLSILSRDARIRGYVNVQKYGELQFTNEEVPDQIIFEEISSGTYVCNQQSATDCLQIQEACGPIAIENCIDQCRSHIDLLFLVTPEALIYHENESNLLNYIDAHILDMLTVWRNSNVNHTVSYNIEYFSEELNYLQNCGDFTCNISTGSTSANSLRNLHDADIVGILAPPGSPWTDTGRKGCVAAYGPWSDYAYFSIVSDAVAGSHLLAHEVGHLFGLEHTQPPQSGFRTCCKYGYRFNTPEGELKETVMRAVGSPSNIPHYSDPKIFYEGEPTGVLDIANDKHINAAGYVRTKGCEVGDFRSKDIPYFFIDQVVEDCMFTLFVENGDELPENMTIEWYSSVNGLFNSNNLTSLEYLGEGVSISLENSKFFDPCENYYFHAALVIETEIVSHRDIVLAGNPCIDNVWCNESESSKMFSNIENEVWTYHYVGGFREGVIRLSFGEEVNLNGVNFNKFERKFNVVDRSSGEIVSGDISPIYIKSENRVHYVSFNGETSDTLYNFSADIGDEWTYTTLADDDQVKNLHYRVIDTFPYNIGDTVFIGQLVEFNFIEHNEFTFIDTIIEGIGFLNSYIDPFEVFYENTEDEIGLSIRCYSLADNKSYELHTDQIYIYDFECGEPISNVPYIDERNDLVLKVNPVRNNIIIENKSSKYVTIKFYSINGFDIGDYVLQANNNIIDSSRWKKGMYIGAADNGQVLKVVKY